jgi:uncharacterized Zn finger protein (UPF0148 family)
MALIKNCRTCGQPFLSKNRTVNCPQCIKEKSKNKTSEFSLQMIERFKSRGVPVPEYCPRDDRVSILSRKMNVRKLW